MKNLLKPIVIAPLMMAMATTAFTSFAVGANKDMSLKTFTEIRVQAPVDVDVSVGKKQAFTMEGRDEDLAKLIIEVRGDTLVIKKERNSGRMKQVKITISMKNLTDFAIQGSSDAKIRDVDSKSFDLSISGSGDIEFDGKSDKLNVSISGSGDINSDGFDAGKVSATISGSGDIELAGKCKSLEMGISGSGDFSGRKLTCADVTARISGSGDAILFASESLEVRASGSSDFEVFGNPKSIRSRSSGSSDLIVHEDK